MEWSALWSFCRVTGRLSTRPPPLADIWIGDDRTGPGGHPLRIHLGVHALTVSPDCPIFSAGQRVERCDVWVDSQSTRLRARVSGGLVCSAGLTLMVFFLPANELLSPDTVSGVRERWSCPRRYFQVYGKLFILSCPEMFAFTN